MWRSNLSELLEWVTTQPELYADVGATEFPCSIAICAPLTLLDESHQILDQLKSNKHITKEPYIKFKHQDLWDFITPHKFNGNPHLIMQMADTLRPKKILIYVASREHEKKIHQTFRLITFTQFELLLIKNQETWRALPNALNTQTNDPTTVSLRQLATVPETNQREHMLSSGRLVIVTDHLIVPSDTARHGNFKAQCCAGKTSGY